MKKIYKSILAAVSLMLLITSCASDEPYITAGPDDTPRFLSPSSIEGSAQTSVSQTREEEFSMELVVTPVNYVTITWSADGHLLGTGTTFTRQFEAGDYDLNIIATTVAGKVAKRVVKLAVSALADDPKVGAKEKNRWLNPGGTHTIEGANLAEVKTLIFVPVVEDALGGSPAELRAADSVELPCTAAADGKSVTVAMPADMAMGKYRLSVKNANAERFGCGMVTVTDEEWVDPDVEEVALWEGNQAADWNADLIKITAEQMANVAVGTEIKVYYTVPEAEYHAMRITSPWWGDTPQDDYVPQFDITDETPNPFIFVFDQHAKDLVEERGAICLVGFGYTVQKVACEMKVGATVLWEDAPVTIDWNADLCKVTAEQMAAVPVGATIYIHYDTPEAEYHAMRITTPWWGDTPQDDLVPQFDLTEETPKPFEFTYDAHCKALVDERGAMCLVGFGYRVSKIEYK